jgi:hypothetical protein
VAEAVYTFCALISTVCAALLIRAWLADRRRLLLASAVCFVGLALNNLMLFIDKVVVTGVDLSVWRSLPALLGLCALLGTLVWEER